MQAEIGVYDSGVGGISFLAMARRLLPAESFVYYGDLANAPYGGRSRQFVLERARAVVKFFKERQVKAMVIACNTATSAAAAAIRAENPGLPILGMEPAMHLAVKQGEKRLLVLATAGTVQGENTRRLLVAEAKRAEIVPLACPGLVELIEEDLAAGRRQRIISYLQEKLAGLPADTALVLGCTHYIFLRPLLAELYPGLNLYDGNLGTARNLQRRLEELELLAANNKQQNLAVYGLPEEKFTAYLKLAERIAEASC